MTLPYPVTEEASGGGFSSEDLDKGQMLMLGKDQYKKPLHADTGDLEDREGNGHSFPCTGWVCTCQAMCLGLYRALSHTNALPQGLRVLVPLAAK